MAVETARLLPPAAHPARRFRRPWAMRRRVRRVLGIVSGGVLFLAPAAALWWGRPRLMLALPVWFIFALFAQGDWRVGRTRC